MDYEKKKDNTNDMDGVCDSRHTEHDSFYHPSSRSEHLRDTILALKAR